VDIPPPVPRAAVLQPASELLLLVMLLLMLMLMLLFRIS
jgi:hypothetical protein